jgi:hypothetical protein
MKKEKLLTYVFRLRMSPQDGEILKRLAALECCSASEVVRIALRELSRQRGIIPAGLIEITQPDEPDLTKE